MAVTKKNKKKGKVYLPSTMSGDFMVFAADLSLRCPGFAVLEYHADTRSATVYYKTHVNNKRKPRGRPEKTNGEILSEIGAAMERMLIDPRIRACVREAAFVKFNKATRILNSVVGAADMTLWRIRRDNFTEITPTAIKEYVTGFGTATKEQVERCLERYVGKLEYKTDDESDAVACGLAWLIRNSYIDDLRLGEDEDEQEDPVCG